MGMSFPPAIPCQQCSTPKNIERTSTVRLACADGTGQPATLQIGEQKATWNLQQLSPDQLFLSFDTNPLPAGCDLTATIDNGKNGSSEPYKLAHIIRIPQIDSVSASGVANGEQKTNTDGVAASPFFIEGKNLEMIEKVGWDNTNGVAVSALPAPLPGEGQKQRLLVDLPAPSNPSPTLYLWLRGDKEGRATTVKYGIL
jgi:hypothetical protein